MSNLVVISDLHCGCQLGLCPPDGVSLDEGGAYHPSRLQKKVWEYWREFWDSWVPTVTKGEDYIVILNGDAIDGVHHQATHQISHNLADQANIAFSILEPVINAERCIAYYHIRGTEAHVGASGQEEERLAQRLGAVPSDTGNYARWDLWIRCGPALCHLMHHIGTSGSMQYESSGPMAELTAAYVEAARWGQEPPLVVVRSHRHRNVEVRVRTQGGFATACTTPAWQLKTPYAYRIAGARQATPQIGGTLIRYGDEEVFTRHTVWNIGRSREESVSGK